MPKWIATACLLLLAALFSPHAEAKGACAPVDLRAAGAATSRAMAERNARLKLQSAAKRENRTVQPDQIRIVCRNQLLWNCTASVRSVGCPD